MANSKKSPAQLRREQKHYGWRSAKPRVQEPRPPTSATRQQPAKVKKTTPCTSPAATKKNETSSETDFQPLVETSTPPSPATPKRQAPPAQPSSGCSTPTSATSNTSMSSEDFQTLESLREGPIVMAEELQQQLQDQEPLLPEADSLMRAEEVTQTTKAVDSPAERNKPLSVQEELDTSNDDSTDAPPAPEPVISSDSLNSPRKPSEVEDMKGALVDSAAQDSSSLVRIALWPLGCIQWCSPALTRPAVNTTVGAVVHIFAAAAALSVICC